jgi:hypothetical protein
LCSAMIMPRRIERSSNAARMALKYLVRPM